MNGRERKTGIPPSEKRAIMDRFCAQAKSVSLSEGLRQLDSLPQRQLLNQGSEIIILIANQTDPNQRLAIRVPKTVNWDTRRLPGPYQSPE